MTLSYNDNRVILVDANSAEDSKKAMDLWEEVDFYNGNFPQECIALYEGDHGVLVDFMVWVSNTNDQLLAMTEEEIADIGGFMLSQEDIEHYRHILILPQ